MTNKLNGGSLIETLALHYSVDELLSENEVDPALVIEWLVDEEYLNLEDYREEEEERDE